MCPARRSESTGSEVPSGGRAPCPPEPHIPRLAVWSEHLHASRAVGRLRGLRPSPAVYQGGRPGTGEQAGERHQENALCLLGWRVLARPRGGVRQATGGPSSQLGEES